MVRLGLALSSAVLLVVAFPSPDRGGLAWIALAPLAFACRDLRPIRAAGVGLLVGGVAAFGLCRWMFEVPGFGARHALLLALYLVASILRAVENRVPVVIASNTGPSAIIDPWGRVLAELPRLFVEGVAVADVPLGGRPTLYTRWGDSFAFAMAAVAALALAMGERRKEDRTEESPTDAPHRHRDEPRTE